MFLLDRFVALTPQLEVKPCGPDHFAQPTDED